MCTKRSPRGAISTLMDPRNECPSLYSIAVYKSAMGSVIVIVVNPDVPDRILDFEPGPLLGFIFDSTSESLPNAFHIAS